jgi:hypothetical protein
MLINCLNVSFTILDKSHLFGTLGFATDIGLLSKGIRGKTYAYLVGFHGNNCTQGEYEWMNVFHVEIIGGYGVRHRVVGQNLWETIQIWQNLMTEKMRDCRLDIVWSQLSFDVSGLLSWRAFLLESANWWSEHSSYMIFEAFCVQHIDRTPDSAIVLQVRTVVRQERL